jgi:hypothetical protein
MEKKTQKELKSDFNLQLKFLKRFCSDYDNGFEEAYIMIAGVLRTLLNDSTASKVVTPKMTNQSNKLLELCGKQTNFSDSDIYKEAKTLSNSLNSLLKSSEQPKITSASLLNQLESQNIPFMDTALSHSHFSGYRIMVNRPDAVRYLDVLKQMAYVNHHPFTGLCYKVISIDKDEEIKIAKFIPLAGDREFKLDVTKTKSFENWWNSTVCDDFNGSELSRKNLIKLIADKYGFAHVDPAKNASVEVYKDFQALMLNPYKPDLAKTYINNPIGTSIRQIGYEVMVTFDKELSHLLDIEYLNNSNTHN